MKKIVMCAAIVALMLGVGACGEKGGKKADGEKVKTEAVTEKKAEPAQQADPTTKEIKDATDAVKAKSEEVKADVKAVKEAAEAVKGTADAIKEAAGKK